MNGIKLLADLLGWPTEKVEKAVRLKNMYRFSPHEKKDGSVRKIYVPHPELKKIQRAILKNVLYRIRLERRANPVIFGFVPGRSYVDNARVHVQEGANFVLRLDFKNAFPSVRRKHLRVILKKAILSEISYYRRDENLSELDLKEIRKHIEYYIRGHWSPLFPVKKARWFRKLISKNDRRFHPVLDDFIKVVLSLTTYQGGLVQGAPTSPWLLNLYLCHSGLVEKIFQFLLKERILVEPEEIGSSRPIISIYSDDITISSSKPIPRYIISKLILLIEGESCFKLNSGKTRIFYWSRTAPLVTGLRLVGMDGNRTVRLPKPTSKRIRGLIHRGMFQEELKPTIEGHLANIRQIYGRDLPNQIRGPLSKYRQSLES